MISLLLSLALTTVPWSFAIELTYDYAPRILINGTDHHIVTYDHDTKIEYLYSGRGLCTLYGHSDYAHDYHSIHNQDHGPFAAVDRDGNVVKIYSNNTKNLEVIDVLICAD